MEHSGWTLMMALLLATAAVATACGTPKSDSAGSEAASDPAVVATPEPEVPVESPVPTEVAVQPTAVFEPTPAPQPETPPIAVRNRALGQGINLGDALDAPNEGDWGVTLEAASFDIVAQAGFDSVRIPIRWSNHAGLDSPYTIDPSFFERVDWALDQTERVGLVAVIDMHHYREPNEDPAKAAPRELLEETGDTAAQWQKLHGFYTIPGLFTEFVHIYLATGLTPGPNNLEFDEHIEVVTIPWDQAIAMVKNHEIEDAKTIAGILMAGLQLELKIN